jgi:hypothetical protein
MLNNLVSFLTGPIVIGFGCCIALLVKFPANLGDSVTIDSVLTLSFFFAPVILYSDYEKTINAMQGLGLKMAMNF